MLSNEARKIIIEAHEKGHKSKEIADIFGVDVSNINKLIRQYKKTGSYELRTHERGRKPTLSEEDKKNIAALIVENPDITINEIIEKLNFENCTLLLQFSFEFRYYISITYLHKARFYKRKCCFIKNSEIMYCIWTA